MKKLSLVIVLTLILGLSFNFQANCEDDLSMVMMTDQAGLGDGGYNDMAWAGFELAKEKLGAEISVIETSEHAEYVPNLISAAEQGYDIVVAVGFLLEDSLKRVAPQYPDTNFVIIDGTVEEPNVVSVLFKEHQAAFLAGLVAGLHTETDNLGFVGGMEIPVVKRFEYGWRAGIKTVNPDTELSFSYVGNFNDPGKAKETALAQYDNGVDIIHEVAGQGGLGVIEAAKDQEKWFVACDKDKSEIGEGHQLTSAMKMIDQSILLVAESVVAGEFEGKVVRYGLKEDAVGLPENTKNVVDEEIMEVVEEMKEKIINGEFKVPQTKEEYEEFETPEVETL